MIFTVGHSNFTKERFLQEIFGIDVIWDIRSHPGSKKYPHFNKEEMRKWLWDDGEVGYEWEPRLGGWSSTHLHLKEKMEFHGVDVEVYANRAFPKQRIGKDTEEMLLNGPQWTNQGLYDYSWFTTLPKFKAAISDLIELSRRRDVAIMCAEYLWWKCHRSMVADYLTFMGVPVYHLQPKISLTKHKDVIGNRLERYHPDILAQWAKDKEDKSWQADCIFKG